MLTDAEAWDRYAAAGREAVSGLTWDKAAAATAALYAPMSLHHWQPFFTDPDAPCGSGTAWDASESDPQG